jgi:DNA-binding transcriptional LysR family regulator
MADLTALIVFAKVVEAKSFSEASRRLKMPISTVSRRIAELEDHLGVRLLERSTRSLRLTEIGTEILDHARRSAEISETIDNAVSYQLSTVSGKLRLSAPPSISDSLLAPLVSAFQAAYPQVCVDAFVTNRFVDFIDEGIDLAFRLGTLKDSSLVAQKILTYRHRLVASPAYLERVKPPETPQELLGHRLLAFSHLTPVSTWSFVHHGGKDQETLTFQPYLSMNDYVGLSFALLRGVGIGELPPVVQPELMRDGRLVELMPKWRFRTFDLSVVHLGNRNMPRPVRVFKQFAVQFAPTLFPALPT